MTTDRDQATRDRLAEALTAHDSPTYWGWAKGYLDPDQIAAVLAPVVADLIREGQAEALRAMAATFEADARHLVGGAAYLQAAEDCRTEAAALRAPRGEGATS